MFPDLSTYKGKKICVAVSGGSDSVALLHYFYTHAEAFGISLSAVNCEHGIRGRESKEDSLFVKKMCEKYGVPLYFFEEDCLALALKRKESVETAARYFRYSSFSKILEFGKADLIATAHHAGDNAETVLFNLCRGTSLYGLRGIGEREGFIRPFINTEKREILEYIERNSLSYREDCTNAETDATRNFLRLEILPKLNVRIPGAIKNISAFSATAESDDSFLYSLAEEKLIECDGEFKIKPCAYPLFSRATVTALKRMGVVKDYTGEHIKSVYFLLSKESSAEISLPMGITAVNEYGIIKIYRKRKKERSFDEILLKSGENLIGGFGVTVDKKEGELRFDRKKLPENAVLRFRKNGDVFKKFGGCTKKLSDFFNEKKIPPEERDFIPLIAYKEKIYCVCGIEISDEIKVEKNSDVYYIHLKKPTRN